MGFTYATLTNAGDQAINQAIANGWTLVITKATCGSGFPATGDVPPQYTDLKAYVMDMNLTSVNASVLYQTTVRVNVNTSSAPSVFVLNEIGVWASLNGGAAFLFGYMTTQSATGGDTIDPGTTIIRDYVVPIVYSQSYPANPVVNITPQVDLHAPTHLPSGVDPIPIASSTIGGLTPKTNNRAAQVLTGPATAAWGPVPVASATDAGGLPPSPADPTQVGVGSNPATWAPVPIVTHLNQGGLPITPLKPNYRPLTAPDGSVSWQPTTPTLNISTTLWVKTGNPDIAPNFSTLQNALAYLGQYAFSPGISVLINVYNGTYANANPIYIDHLNGSQITIQGINANGNLDNDVSFTGLGSVSGTPGNWTVQLTGCANVSAVTVGNYILVFSTSGISSTGNALVCGFFKVLAVSGNVVTVQVPWQRSTWPVMTGFTGGTFTPINAIFTTTASAQTGIVISQHGVGAMRNLGVVATGPQPNNYGYNAILAGGPTNFNRVGATGFSNNIGSNAGFQCSAANSTLTCCAATNNSTGLISVGNGSQVTCFSCAFTHNGCMGVWCQGGSALAMHGVTFVAGNGYLYQSAGILVADTAGLLSQGDSNAGSYWPGAWWSVLNAYQGMVVTNKSLYTQSSQNDYFFAANNGQLGVAGTVYDVYISTLSLVNSVSITGSRLFNVPVGTLTADGSLIT